MLSPERLSQLVAKIYDAAADRARWPAFLEDFADVVHGTATAILHYDSALPIANLDAGINYAPDYARNYLNYYHKLNPWTQSWKSRMNRAGLDSISPSEDRISLRDLEKTEFYNDHLRPHDTIHQIGGMIDMTEQRHSGFTCLRTRQAGPFGADDVDLLRLLFPHLERAMQFNRRFAALDGSHRTSLDVLDMLTAGVILLNRQGRILFVNRAAQRILDQNDGLAATTGGLAAASSDQSQEMRSRIASAAITACGRGLSDGGVLAIRRPSNKRPLALLIMPAASIAFPAGTETPAVVALVNDPEMKIEAAPEVLGRLYGLTPAESRLVGELLKDATLMGAAEQIGISHNTARTHLARIFDKTGTRHQGELIRVLTSSVAGLRSS